MQDTALFGGRPNSIDASKLDRYKHNCVWFVARIYEKEAWFEENKTTKETANTEFLLDYVSLYYSFHTEIIGQIELQIVSKHQLN